MDKKLLEIINHYGIKAQLKHLYSELYELTEVITSLPNENMMIADELADIHVLIRQLQLIYEITDEDIKERMEFKVNRQIERIEHE